MHFNPYRPPEADVDAAGDVEAFDHERIRAQYLSHESAIRSVGWFYYFGVALVVAVAILQIAMMGSEVQAEALVVIALLSAVAGFFYWVGRGLRTLKPVARNVSAFVSILGLFSFPVGTLINAYILKLLFSDQGKIVFSEAYRRTIEATPKVKHRTPLIAWVVIVLLLLSVVGSLVVPIAGGL